MFDNINTDMQVDLSKSNTETFRALHRKLVRDYRPFLAAMLKKYPGPSNISTAVNEAIRETDSTIDLFANALREKVITGGVAEELATSVHTSLASIGSLFQANMRNDEFTASFQQKLEQIKKETGLGTEALTVSAKVVEQGIREAKTTKGRGLEMLKPLAPVGRGMKGLASGAMHSLAGPFAPMAAMGAGVIGSAGKRMLSSMAKKHDGSGTAAALAQMGVRAGEVQTDFKNQGGGFGGGGAFPGVGPTKPMTGRGSMLAGMVLFYNKHAYTAKWTKELLESTKKTQKNTAGLSGGFKGGIGDSIMKGLGITALGSQFKGLGKGIGGLTGKAGALATFALRLGGISLILAEVAIIGKSIFDWKTQRDKTRETIETARATAVKNSQVMQSMGIASVMAGTGKTEAQLVEEKAQRRKDDYGTAYDDLMSTFLGRRVAQFKGITRKPRAEEDYQRLGAGEIGAITRKQQSVLSARAKGEAARGTSEEDIAILMKELRDMFTKSNEEFLKAADKRFGQTPPTSQLHGQANRPRIDTRDSYDPRYIGGVGE